MDVVLERSTGGPALDAAIAHALLLRAARGELPATLRLYRPAPTVAFGRLDALREGYGAAAQAALHHGFTPVLRGPGGHGAAYDERTLVFDLVTPAPSALVGLQELFRETSASLARELGALGVDARVGAVPGEYCRGDYSVGARGRVKLIGTAQRRIRGAALLGGFLTFGGAARLRAVLADVYAALELEWDPRSLGALEDELPGATIADAERAIVTALAPVDEAGTPALAGLDDTTRALAAELEPRHVVIPAPRS